MCTMHFLWFFCCHWRSHYLYLHLLFIGGQEVQPQDQHESSLLDQCQLGGTRLLERPDFSCKLLFLDRVLGGCSLSPGGDTPASAAGGISPLFLVDSQVVLRPMGALFITILSSLRNPKLTVDCEALFLPNIVVVMAKPPVMCGSITRGKVGHGTRPMCVWRQFRAGSILFAFSFWIFWLWRITKFLHFLYQVHSRHRASLPWRKGSCF